MGILSKLRKKRLEKRNLKKKLGIPWWKFKNLSKLREQAPSEVIVPRRKPRIVSASKTKKPSLIMTPEREIEILRNLKLPKKPVIIDAGSGSFSNSYSLRDLSTAFPGSEIHGVDAELRHQAVKRNRDGTRLNLYPGDVKNLLDSTGKHADLVHARSVAPLLIHKGGKPFIQFMKSARETLKRGGMLQIDAMRPEYIVNGRKMKTSALLKSLGFDVRKEINVNNQGSKYSVFQVEKTGKKPVIKIDKVEEVE